MSIKTKLINLFFITSLSLAIIYSNSISVRANEITLEAPSEVEAPHITPLNISLSSPLVSGETLDITSSGRPTYSITVNGSVEIDKLLTRIRLVGGDFKATIIKQDGSTLEESGYSKILDIDIPVRPNTYRGKKSRQKASKGSFFFKFDNKQEETCYISQVTIITNKGEIKILMTPQVSGMPFFGAKGNFDSGRITSSDLNCP